MFKHRAVKIGGILLVVYVLIVVVFESLLGYYQPSSDATMVITTTDADGGTHPRVVTQVESDGRLYVAANHWPRAWYRRALANPNISVTVGDETKPYLAVPVDGDEHERADAARPRSAVFLLLTGFPPRYFLRLDPV